MGQHSLSREHTVIACSTLPQTQKPQVDTTNKNREAEHFCSTTDRAVYYHNHLITGQVSFLLHPQPFSSPFRSSVTQTFTLNCISEKSAATKRSKRKERRKTELMCKHIMKIGIEQAGCVVQKGSCGHVEVTRTSRAEAGQSTCVVQQRAAVRQGTKGIKLIRSWATQLTLTMFHCCKSLYQTAPVSLCPPLVSLQGLITEK